MLKLRNICKYYWYGKNKKIVLDNINMDFTTNEMVFIVGKSGSGKSTLLNIIASNLKSDAGCIYLDGKCISNSSEKYLNFYRNNMVGYIYQDYNLIEYMNVFDNIMIGCNNSENSSIDELLKEFSLEDKKYTIVSKLSGGEKQRVAIIRTLINNPRIILADEPTGAMDYENGIKIMDMLKKIAVDRIVIVVSHDMELALKYASRIVNITDGKVINGTLDIDDDNYKKSIIKKKKFYIGKIAIKDLLLKKGRTLKTCISLCLGFFSMLLVLCLSSNFNKELVNLEKNTVSILPISITNGEYLDKKINNFNKLDKIYGDNTRRYVNKISSEYLDYLDSLDVKMNVVKIHKKGIPFVSDRYKIIDNNMRVIPSRKYILDNYDIVFGRGIENKNEVLLKIDKNNVVNANLSDAFKIGSSIEYADIIGRKIRIIDNNLYYINKDSYYYINYDNKQMFNDSQVELTIVGIVREKEDNIGGSFIYYDGDIIEKIIDINKNSDIVKLQNTVDYNVLGLDIDRDIMLNYLGNDYVPSGIDIYVDNLKDKELVLKKLDNYNKSSDDKVKYQDVMADNIKIVHDFINIISFILIIFSIVSIIITLFMIGILTSVRVLEQKKEIGIIRSLGASRRDVKRLFNSENIIMGIIASVTGLIILSILKNSINIFIANKIGIDNLLVIDKKIFLQLMVINILIIRLAGSIPARRASKLSITECIYNR